MPHPNTTLLAIGLACTLSTPLKTLATPPALNAPASDSSSAAAIPQAAGYSNVTNAQLQTLLDQGSLLIDIRREDEWRATGLIEKAVPLTFFLRDGQLNPQFAPELLKLAPIDKPLALVCRSGNRTRFASSAIAQQLGYKQVFNVTHGMKGWLLENRPVVAYTPR